MGTRHGIDYSKWDHFGDDDSIDDDDEEDAVVPPFSRGGVPPSTASILKEILADSEEPFESFASFKDLQTVRAALRKTREEGKVEAPLSKDLLSASMLLSAVTPFGLDDREFAAAKKQDLGCDDPVHSNLWDLTMKIREDVKHVEELLQVNVIDRILSVVQECKAEKYKSHHIAVNTIKGLVKTMGEPLSRYENILAKRLSSDSKDITSSLSVLHEMCRYRVGCLALAQHKQCLEVLLVDIPFEKMAMLGVTFSLKFNFAPGASAGGENDWGDPVQFCIGMMEQCTIDIFGRLLHGLDDENQSLRQDVGELIRSKIDSYESRLQSILAFMSNEHLTADPQVGHCINLQSSLAHLRTMLTNLESNSESKPWRSTFRLDRHLVPRNDASTTTTRTEDCTIDACADKRKCYFCNKPLEQLMQCSRWRVKTKY